MMERGLKVTGRWGRVAKPMWQPVHTRAQSDLANDVAVVNADVAKWLKQQLEDVLARGNDGGEMRQRGERLAVEPDWSGVAKENRLRWLRLV